MPHRANEYELNKYSLAEETTLSIYLKQRLKDKLVEHKQYIDKMAGTFRKFGIGNGGLDKLKYFVSAINGACQAKNGQRLAAHSSIFE